MRRNGEVVNLTVNKETFDPDKTQLLKISHAVITEH
jgi:hypothetical protein